MNGYACWPNNSVDDLWVVTTKGNIYIYITVKPKINKQGGYW